MREYPLAGLRGTLQTGNCRLRKKSQKACIRMRRGTKFVGIIAVARRVMAKTAGDICAIELIVEEIGRLTERSEEHTSELQSLMRTSYAVFCLKKKNTLHRITTQLNKAKPTATETNT